MRIQRQGPTPHLLKDEGGLALLLTVFVIAIAMIIVTEMGFTARFDQRAYRSLSEGVQANYLLKSLVTFSQVLLELPEPKGRDLTWRGEPWSLISSMPSLPVSIPGQPRVYLVDDSGRLSVNAILGGEDSQKDTPQNRAAAFWREAMLKLFDRAGFVAETYKPELRRTVGNRAFDADQQVAVLIDYMDTDSKPFNVPGFTGEGIENASLKQFFANKKLSSIDELRSVPGMTGSRIQRVAPFLNASPTVSVGPRINVNTASAEVLYSIGLPESIIPDIMQPEDGQPLTQEELKNVFTGAAADLLKYVEARTSGSDFTMYGRVQMPSVTRWVTARIKRTGSAGPKNTDVVSYEIY